jgi:hypothetical protein
VYIHTCDSDVAHPVAARQRASCVGAARARLTFRGKHTQVRLLSVLACVSVRALQTRVYVCVCVCVCAGFRFGWERRVDRALTAVCWWWVVSRYLVLRGQLEERECRKAF